MALLTKQTSTNYAVNPVTYAAAAGGGDTVAVNSGEIVKLYVKNGDASAKTVTIVDPRTQYGQPSPDLPVVIANGNAGHTEITIPPEFGDANGVVAITYSAVTSVTVAAVRV